MSVRVDTASLIAGACVVGNRGLGVLGAVIRATTATGTHGPGYLYNDLTGADDLKEIQGLILTVPSDGAFVAYEDGSFTLTGAADGTYSFTYRLFADGADLGTATGSITIGVGGDTTAPTLAGSISIGAQTSTSYTATCPVAADDTAVTGYQYRLNGGAWVTIGAGGRTASVSGRAPGTTDSVEMRAFDAAANYSSALSTSVTLAPAVVTVSTVRRLLLRELLRGVT